MNDRQPTVAIEQISLTLGTNSIFSQLSLSIDASNGCAVVGESGSGKSTLLSLIMGMLAPDEGQISVFGQPVNYADTTPLRRRLGLALQETGLFPHLSVRANLSLPAQLAGLSATVIEQRIVELRTLLRLDEELLDRYPHALSGGQRQRAGICRSMMLRPELLLLDEPFSGLDPLTKRRIYGDYLQLCEKHQTAFVLVTHDLVEASELCEHIVVLRDGKVEQAGAIGSVIRCPESAYVCELIDAQRGLLT